MTLEAAVTAALVQVRAGLITCEENGGMTSDEMVAAVTVYERGGKGGVDPKTPGIAEWLLLIGVRDQIEAALAYALSPEASAAADALAALSDDERAKVLAAAAAPAARVARLA